MKIYIIYFMLFVLCGWLACTEEKEFEGWPDEDQPVVPVGPPGVPGDSVKAMFAFADTLHVALKNAGRVEIPVVLSESLLDTLYLKVKTVATENCEQDREFTLENECIIPKDSVNGMVILNIRDDQKPGDEMSILLELEKTVGSPVSVGIGEKGRCRVTIANNAVVFFPKVTYTTWEAAHIRPNALEIPLKIVGQLTEEARLMVTVKQLGTEDAGMPEKKRWELENDTLTLEPGAEQAVVRFFTIDDKEVNEDRIAEIQITEVHGGNIAFGRDNRICRVTVQSEEIAKVVQFAELNYTVAENVDGNVLQVPVIMDLRADEPVTVGLAAVDGTAVSGTDYRLLTDEVTIPVGDTIAYARIAIIDDQQVNYNRDFQLRIITVAGGNAFVSDVNTCNVVIANDDLPEWSATVPEYTFEEASGEQQITITLKETYDADITVYLSPVNATYGIELVEIIPVTIPANTVSANVIVNMMANPLKEPAPFALQVTKVNNTNYTTPVTIARITPTACRYRKMLGNWTWTAEAVWNILNPITVVLTSGNTDAEKRANFNNKFVCSGNLMNELPFQWSFKFEPATKTMNLVMNEKVFHSPLDGGTTYCNFVAYENVPSYKYYEMQVNDANTEIKWVSDWYVNGGVYRVSDNGYNGSWFWFYRITMTRN